MESGINISHVFLHLGVSLFLWILVIVAVLIDLWDGVQTARFLGQRVHSHKLRVTIRKIGEYWRFILMGFVADTIGILFPFWALPYLSIIICLCIIGIEFKSVREHAKKQKSRVAEIPTMAKEIIECVNERDAISLLIKLQKALDEANSKLMKYPEDEN